MTVLSKNQTRSQFSGLYWTAQKQGFQRFFYASAFVPKIAETLASEHSTKIFSVLQHLFRRSLKPSSEHSTKIFSVFQHLFRRSLKPLPLSIPLRFSVLQHLFRRSLKPLPLSIPLRFSVLQHLFRRSLKPFSEHSTKIFCVSAFVPKITETLL